MVVHTHLDQILTEDSPEAKRLGLKYKPPNPDEDIPGLLDKVCFWHMEFY
jgi:hypothetical protein